MTPWRKRDGDGQPRWQSLNVWKLATTAALLLAAAALFLSAYLFTKVNEAQKDTDEAVAEVAASNKATNDLTCALGDLVQLSGQPRALAIRGPTFHLKAELDFLQTILVAGCPVVQSHEDISHEIEGTITAIKRELTRREAK